MVDSIVLYASPEHLNSMLVLATFIAKHHTSIHVILLCSAPAPPSLPPITYHRLSAAPPPPTPITDPVELFFELPRLNNPTLRQALLQISTNSNIKAFVIDFFCNSAFQVSTSLNIPTFYYVSSGGFGLCVFLYFPTIHDHVAGDIAELNDFIRVPGCPPIHSSDIPKAMIFRHTNTYKHFLDTAINMRKAAGIIVNAFDAMEYRAKEAISNGLCVPNSPTPPVYFAGPLVAEITGGDHDCLTWLDSQPRKSVIFLCFGRRGLFSAQQIQQTAIGLENCGHRFLWSVRSPPDQPAEVDELLPEGFLERTKGRGFVVKSWAPQKEVLSHDSVGGFVTHCGRSSILEAVSFGVPMIAWPVYAEQKMNRVFLVEEMNLALRLMETPQGLVTAAELENQIRELMDSSTGAALRHRAADIRISAAAAVQENGSSLASLGQFIRSVTS